MSVFTGLDDNDCEHGDLVSVEYFTGVADDLNYLIDSTPPGKIIMVLYGLSGVPQPNPKYWQLCDGSMITDETSPLRGFATPDYALVGRYMRGYSTIGQVGNYGGANTKDLKHKHTGFTQLSGTVGTDTDNDFYTSVSHGHYISDDLLTVINFEPVHYRILHYIKIA